LVKEREYSDFGVSGRMGSRNETIERCFAHTTASLGKSGNNIGTLA
jgi:hypothetical protein